MTEGPGPEGRAEGLVSASASEQPDDARGPNPVPLSATENAQTARGHLDLPSTVTLLKAPGPPFRDSPQECEVYILGTAHISKASCEDVRKVISAVRPEVVFLELCQERRSLLTCTAADFKPLPLNKLVAEVRKGLPLFTAVYSWMLCRVGESLDAPPGEEFRVALEEARKVNAKVVLGDRRVSITIARTWAAMKLVGSDAIPWQFNFERNQPSRSLGVGEHERCGCCHSNDYGAWERVSPVVTASLEREGSVHGLHAESDSTPGFVIHSGCSWCRACSRDEERMAR
eukprot:jgi/Botrbrau1/13799/Bobra.0056s0047.1